MKRPFLTVLLLILVTPLLTACFINDSIQSDQVGVISDGGRLVRCVEPGVHSDLGFFTDLREVNISAIGFEVLDPEVATEDSQLVGVTIYVQLKRKSDCASIQDLLTNWSSIAFDDTALTDSASAQAKEAIKVGVRNFTLEELLSDRAGLATSIKDSLTEDASRFNVEILAVSVKDVDLDDAFAAQLQQKALLAAQIETEKRRQDLIIQQAENDRLVEDQRRIVLEAQLEAERAQTAIDVEIAARDGQVIAAKNEVYQTNTSAYELERLRLLREVLGGNSVVYFVQDMAELNLLLGASGTNVVPLPDGDNEPAPTPTPEP